jgi:transcriptional regulator with XRE-family HTH domain
MSFDTRIRQLRDQKGASQQDIADAIDVARATYSNWELGKRDPDLGDINKLAEYYQISPAELISSDTITVDESVVPYKFKEKNDIIPRDIDPKIKPEKLREVLLYILEKVGAKSNVGETVLYKLLYFIDFDYYEKTGQSITGLTYICNHYGPTPAVEFKGVVEGMEEADELERVNTKYFNNVQRKYLPNKKSSLKNLTAGEIKHIDETLARLSDKSVSELTELSHYDTPWLVAKQGKKIDYRDVFYRTARTAVTEPEDEL